MSPAVKHPLLRESPCPPCSLWLNYGCESTVDKPRPAQPKGACASPCPLSADYCFLSPVYRMPSPVFPSSASLRRSAKRIPYRSMFLRGEVGGSRSVVTETTSRASRSWKSVAFGFSVTSVLSVVRDHWQLTADKRLFTQVKSASAVPRIPYAVS